jgi:4-amino-4-deoxy-L-arabinose transferase-like glycosyltransferase
MRLTTTRYVILLAAISFLLRLAVVLLMRDITHGPTSHASADDMHFHQLGLHVADGTGYQLEGKPTSFRAPGYPFLLAAVYATVGDCPPVVYVLHCLLGALACVLTYLLARELLGEGLARLAGVLACFYLGHIYFATNYVSENLFVPCLGLGTWLAVRYVKGAGVGWLAVAGLVLGYAALTRPLALLLLGMLPPVFALYDYRRSRWPLASCGLFAAAFLAVILPWTYRNYQVHGEWVLATTNGGSTFYGANNDRVVSEVRGFGYWYPTTDLPHRDLIEAQKGEVAHDRMEWKLGKDWLREHPEKIPQLLLFKFLRLWWLPDFDGGRFYYVLRAVLYAPYFLLMLLGAVRVLRHRQYWTFPWLVVHVTLLDTVLTALIFFGDPRFRDGNLPLLMLYAALGADVLRGRAGSVSDGLLLARR